MSKHNDPFYFALPRGSRRADVSAAAVHIADTFGVVGKPEVVRVDQDFALCRIASVSA